VLKKFKKLIYKRFMENNQHMYVSPECYTNGKDYVLDIHMTDSEGKKWNEHLFEIRTLSAFKDTEYRGVKKYFHDLPFEKQFITVDKFLDFAHVPLYVNKPWRVFTLKKFGTITEKDVEKCVRYFMNEILDAWWCFNIKVFFEKETGENNG
jgi:hypothetical protein